MKILSFSSCFPSGKDPARGIFVLQRLSALAKLAEIDVVHPVPWFPGYKGQSPQPGCKQEKIAGLAVHHQRFFYLPGLLKSLDGRFYSRGLHRWLGRYFSTFGRSDILDAHFAWPDGVGVSHLARRFGLPFTITLRGKINSRIRNRSMRAQIAEALCRADAVISVSRQMAETALSLGVAEEKIIVIPNGVDQTLFSPTGRIEARRVLGLDDRGPLLACVAAVEHNKGHEEMIEAVSSLPSDVRLVIVGGQTDGGVYLRRLGRIVEEKGLTGRVTFVGCQPHEKIATYFNAADVSVLFSHAEGCPNVVLESLACGTPVV
ncbi:MAG: glycosyltransferase, partial [Phycisphaerae bacterium]|nr:glycosyltransferase [Phycisphaerae bacterium]